MEKRFRWIIYKRFFSCSKTMPSRCSTRWCGARKWCTLSGYFVELFTSVFASFLKVNIINQSHQFSRTNFPIEIDWFGAGLFIYKSQWRRESLPKEKNHSIEFDWVFWLWKWFIKYSLFLLFEAFNHWRWSDELEKLRNVIKFHWKWGFSQFILLFYFHRSQRAYFSNYSKKISLFQYVSYSHSNQTKYFIRNSNFKRAFAFPPREKEITLISRTQNE